MGADGGLAAAIDAAWEVRETLNPATGGPVAAAVEAAIAGLDSGALRVAERGADGVWGVNQWLKGGAAELSVIGQCGGGWGGIAGL